MCEKTNQTKHDYQWCGLCVHIQGPSHLGDGRWQSNLYIYVPGCRKALRKEVIRTRSVEETVKKARVRAPRLILNAAEEILQLVRDGGFPDATLELYFELRRERICRKRKWAGHKKTYLALWEETLKEAFGKKRFSELDTEAKIKAVMRSTLRTDTEGGRAGEKERESWLILDSIFVELLEDGILSSNPAQEKARKCRRRQEEIILENLGRRSLTIDEMKAFSQQCLQRMPDSLLHAMLLLRLLTGITVYEACALNVGDWVMNKEEDVSWLEITKEYRQQRGHDPINHLLDSANQYRKIVCTREMEVLLRQCVKKRRAEGCKKTDALFTENGIRLEPETVKAETKRILNEVVQEGLHLSFQKRNPLGQGDSRSLANTDILRGTAEYSFRTICGMPLAESRVLLGLNRVSTFAIWYVDWCNVQVLQHLRQEMEQWHSTLLQRSSAAELSGGASQPGFCQERVLIGSAESCKGETPVSMLIQALCGINGYIESIDPAVFRS